MSKNKVSKDEFLSNLKNQISKAVENATISGVFTLKSKIVYNDGWALIDYDTPLGLETCLTSNKILTSMEIGTKFKAKCKRTKDVYDKHKITIKGIKEIEVIK